MAFPHVATLVVRQLRRDNVRVEFGLIAAMINEADPLRALTDFVTDGLAAIFHVIRKIGNRPATRIFRLLLETVALTMQGADGSAHATV